MNTNVLLTSCLLMTASSFSAPDEEAAADQGEGGGRRVGGGGGGLGRSDQAAVEAEIPGRAGCLGALDQECGRGQADEGGHRGGRGGRDGRAAQAQAVGQHPDQADAAPFLGQVKKNAAASRGDVLDTAAQLFSAVTPQAAEQVAGQRHSCIGLNASQTKVSDIQLALHVEH